ncbi:MAG: pyridoxal-dependent decarboxylase [Candidatus Dormibacteraeota bacterium]|nr:pyridoxal-dependent decarboxylase [Candidatus Dormibacteraeota bacterium]
MKRPEISAVPLGDIDTDEFRAAARRAVDWIGQYLDTIGERPVLSKVAPGEIRRSLPAVPPEEGERLEVIFEDFKRLVLPGITHWNHPRFFAYFGITGSAPGILAELLCAALNVNGMLWRTSPAATEVEEVACDWLRQSIGLPPEFVGVINDTASSSTLYALAAAREAIPDIDVRRQGLAGVRLRMYTSEESHSSVEKAGMVLGIGQHNVVKIRTDSDFRMDVDALSDAIRDDHAAGFVPFAVVATVGTTSVTAVDPVAGIADVCEREKLWLHVDAAYGGAAAVLESHRWIMAGCERAHSFLVNPHKWLFTPIDCSVLYCRREDLLKRAFSLTPAYLTTGEGESVRNLMDYGASLGRRFRGLKLWFVLRAFGIEGARKRIAAHIDMAQQLRGWIEADEDFELLAPTPFSTVVFRHCSDDGTNERIHDSVNGSGEAFISHTDVRGRYALRIAIGNLRTTLEDVRSTWDLIKKSSSISS